MEQWQIKENRMMAEVMLARQGYAPDPECKVCNGFGRVHPMMPDGRIDYSTVISCPAPNCMADAFRRRGL